jgi:hypothetical protein
MAYIDFQLSELIKTFGLTLTEAVDLFADVEEVECSDNLAFNLKESILLAVAIGTEKARSEMIIVPILLEMKRRLNHQISLFSGTDFNVDFEHYNQVADAIKHFLWQFYLKLGEYSLFVIGFNSTS